MKNIQDHKIEAILNKKFNYPEGVMTRREWLKIKIIEGWQSNVKELRNYAAEEKIEKWLDDHRDDLSGNPNWPPTKRYLEEKERLKAGIFKTEYSIEKDRSSYEITKTEYDHFNSLVLEEDIRTEQMNLSNRIEAGIATKEEIQEDQDKESQFFNKYFTNI